MLGSSPISATPISSKIEPILGSTFDATLVAAGGDLSAEAILGGRLFNATLIAAGADLTGGFALGQFFDANMQARSAGLDATVYCGQLFNASMSAKAGRLVAEVTSWGQFAGSFTAAAGGLSGDAVLDAVPQGFYFTAVSAAASLAPVDAVEATYTIPTDTPTAWVVNLHTGGHACYTDALASTVVTPAFDLGIPAQKIAFDIYAHLRTDGAAQVRTILDEQRLVTCSEILPDGRSGIRRRRSEHSRGAEFMEMQIIFENVDGADFTLKQIETTPVISRRVSRSGGV